jgi:hypothetical protein
MPRDLDIYRLWAGRVTTLLFLSANTTCQRSHHPAGPPLLTIARSPGITMVLPYEAECSDCHKGGLCRQPCSSFNKIWFFQEVDWWGGGGGGGGEEEEEEEEKRGKKRERKTKKKKPWEPRKRRDAMSSKRKVVVELECSVDLPQLSLTIALNYVGCNIVQEPLL